MVKQSIEFVVTAMNITYNASTNVNPSSLIEVTTKAPLGLS